MAAADLTRASQTLAGLENPADRLTFTDGLFDALAQGNPATALDAVKQLESAAEKQAALAALLKRWRGVDNDLLPLRARELAGGSMEAALGKELLAPPSIQPELAALWARTLTQGTDRAELLTEAMTREYATNPALAESFGEDLTGEDRTNFDEFLARARISADPAAAWQQSLTLSDPAARAVAQNNVIELWGQTDPEAAAARLAEMPAAARNFTALEGVALNYADHTDLATAVAWARTLPEDEASFALKAIGGSATADLGMMLDVDAAGNPFVLGMVQGYSFAPENPLRTNDRILGVGQADGSFVDVAHLDLLQVAGLINGTPGTLVQLQIAPKTLSGYGTPTVVSLVRPPAKH